MEETMKSNVFFIAVSIVMILAGCTQENDFGSSNLVSGNYTLNAIIENDDRTLTRTTVNENGQVLWTENDCIGVFGNKGTKNASFALSKGFGEMSGSFKGNLSVDEEAETAYYPYAEDAALNGNTLTFTLPTEYTYTGNSNAPMLGVKNENGDFQFKHLAGLLKIVVNSVPTGISKFVITSEGENAPALAGSAEVADIADVDNPLLTIKGKEEQSITYNLKGVTESQLTFFVPIPVGTYPKLSVRLLMEDGTELLSKTVSNQEVKRATMIVLPVLEAGSEGTISPDYVAIDWNHAKIESMNLPTGEFTLAFNGNNKPDFEDGLSIVVLQTDTSAYLKRVMHSSVNGNKVRLQTQDATMEELFRNTEFTLSIGEGAQTRLITSQGNVITPSKIVKVYEDNSYEVVYDEMAMTRSDYVEIDPTLPIPIYYIDRSNTSVSAIWEAPNNKPIGAGVSLTAEKFIQSLTAIYKMHFKFSPAVYEKEITKDFKVNISEIEKFSYTPSLSFQSRTVFSFSANAGLNWDVSEEDILPPAKVFYIFFIGPVPVFFVQNGLLKGSFEVGIEGKVSVGCGYELEGDFTVGFEYEKGEGVSPVIENSFIPTIHPFKAQLGSSIYAKASIYPEVNVMLYDLIGPSLAIVPYVEGRLSSTLLALPYATWSSVLGVGLDLKLGAEPKFLKGVKAEFTKNLLSGELYRAPKFIELLEPQNGIEAEANQPIPVTFCVTDEWKLPFTEPKENPVESALVQFKATGNSKVSQEYAWTDERGIVMAEWTPTSSKDTLYAILWDEKRDTLSKAYFAPKIEDFSIVGRWYDDDIDWFLPEPVPHPSYEDSDHYLEFFADGTFEHCYNPWKKVCGFDLSNYETHPEIYNCDYASGILWEFRRGTYTFSDSVLTTHTTYYHSIYDWTLYRFGGAIVEHNYEELFTAPDEKKEIGGGKIRLDPYNNDIIWINSYHAPEQWKQYVRITEDFKPELLDTPKFDE